MGWDTEDLDAAIGGYELRGSIKGGEQIVEMRLQLFDGDDEIASASRFLDIKWIPEWLVDDSLGKKRYSESARAFLSAELPERKARWAAKNLARAKVVAKAVGSTDVAIQEIRSDADGIAALRALAHGSPGRRELRILARREGRVGCKSSRPASSLSEHRWGRSSMPRSLMPLLWQGPPFTSCYRRQRPSMWPCFPGVRTTA